MYDEDDYSLSEWAVATEKVLGSSDICHKEAF